MIVRGVTSSAPRLHSWFRTGLSTCISLAGPFRRFGTGLQKSKPPDERRVERILPFVAREAKPHPTILPCRHVSLRGRRKLSDMHSENTPGLAAQSQPRRYRQFVDAT